MNEELVFNPTRLDISRSVFPVKIPAMGTGFVGRLNTLKPIEVLPGESYDLDLSSLIRFTTPIFPTMDDLYMDVFAYYTSDEMLLRRQSFSPSLSDGNHSFAAVMGAQDGFINMPYPDASLTLPSVSYMMLKYKPSDASATTSAIRRVLRYELLDQLGYPILIRDSAATPASSNVHCSDFNCLPLLSYLSIWNEDFREPNCMNRYALTITAANYAKITGDLQTMVLDNDVGHIYSYVYGDTGKPIVWDDVSYTPEILGLCETLPVCRFHGLYGSLLPFPQRNSVAVTLPLGDVAPVFSGADHLGKFATANNPVRFGKVDSTGGTLGTINGRVLMTDANHTLAAGSTDTDSGLGNLGITNLWTDLGSATAASINTIRTAFQTQKWFEALARGGNSDLDEYINSIFGVVGPTDVEAKRPVYLGGKRIPINISQVNDTASALGSTGGFSLTTDADHYVTYHSKTYGMIHFVFCIRHADKFVDAPQKFLLRKSKFDFYAPQFANLGEESYDKAMLAWIPGGTGSVLGYQEYAADYRYDIGTVHGQLRFAPLSSWHYATILEAGKFDLKTWLDASYQALDVDRTLKTTGAVAFMQFQYDFLVYGKRYAPMPVNSIPGLVDHH